MPLYNFTCSCGNEFEDLVRYEDIDNVICTCGRHAKVKVSVGTFNSFHEGYYEHIAADPIYVTSKDQLKDECEKNNKYSNYIDDM